MQAINEARVNVWKQQDNSFFDQATIDVDGVIVATTAQRLLTTKYRMFLSVCIHVPCQIIRHARQTVHRLQSWTDYTPAFFRLG